MEWLVRLDSRAFGACVPAVSVEAQLSGPTADPDVRQWGPGSLPHSMTGCRQKNGVINITSFLTQ